MSSRDRKKASDIFRETEYVFSKKVSFNEAFPEIVEISIEVKEYEDFMREPQRNGEWERAMGTYSFYPRIHRFSKNHFSGEYVDCSNSSCYNGGFSIGSIIREMVNKKEKSSEGKERCQGYEGSPKGKRRYRDCSHEFDYKINIKYKEKDSTT